MSSKPSTFRLNRALRQMASGAIFYQQITLPVGPFFFYLFCLMLSHLPFVGIQMALRPEVWPPSAWRRATAGSRNLRCANKSAVPRWIESWHLDLEQIKWIKSVSSPSKCNEQPNELVGRPLVVINSIGQWTIAALWSFNSIQSSPLTRPAH